MSEFFPDELTSEISGAHSITDILILFGDYKVNYFNQKKEFLTEFASNNGLELVNKNTPTWTNGNQETLVDHCLTTKHHVFDTTLIEQLFGSDSFTHFFLSSLDIDYENTKTKFFIGILENLSELILTKNCIGGVVFYWICICFRGARAYYFAKWISRRKITS